MEYNYAVFTEVVFGRRTYQGFGAVAGDWLPIDYPKDDADEAITDCYAAHEELGRRGIRQDYRLDPDVRTFDWSGPRRMLK